MKIVQLLTEYKWAFRYLPQSILFNLKYLPWHQAKHLPILLRKCTLKNSRCAKFVIDSDSVYPGMIKLGFYGNSLFEDKGIYLDVGGTIIFKGACVIGNQSRLSVAKGAVVEFGQYFYNSASLKIACYSSLVFGNNVIIGWNSLFVDNDFHLIKEGEHGNALPMVKSITIGNHSWLACNCVVMKGSVLPPNSIVSANSMVNKDYSAMPEHVLFAGIPAVPQKENIFMA